MPQRSPASRWPTFRSAPSCRAASTARPSVALYQKYSSVPVRTFSIGFEESGFNEAEDAKRVAAHLGTVHQERYVTVREARDVIPLLPADVRRALRRFVADPDPSRQPVRARAGDRRADRRRRRRIVRRLQPPLRGAAAVAAAAAGSAAARAAAGSPLSRMPSRLWSDVARLRAGPPPAAPRRQDPEGLCDWRPRLAASTRSIRASSTNGATSARR